MSLINKMNKILKDNSLADSYADYVIDDYKSMQIKINKLKEVITTLSHSRRKNQENERIELVDSLFRTLTYIENGFDEFEFNYIDLCHLITLHEKMKLTPKISSKVSFAINTKNELRKDCETIYRNFKNMAKKLDNIPMKEILKRMREVFDFGGTKQNEEIEYVQKKYLANRYWDSTSMTFRPLR